MIIERSRRRVLIVLAAGVLLLAGGGIAYATIPAAGGVINGCFNSTTGALRVIDYPNRHCAHGERFLRWNQKGQAGPQGVQGPPGISGYEQKVHQVFVPGGTSLTFVSAICSPGKKVLGGGYDFETGIVLVGSEPSDGAGNTVADRWTADVSNPQPNSRQVTVTAICAFVP